MLYLKERLYVGCSHVTVCFGEKVSKLIRKGVKKASVFLVKNLERINFAQHQCRFLEELGIFWKRQKNNTEFVYTSN